MPNNDHQHDRSLQEPATSKQAPHELNHIHALTIASAMLLHLHIPIFALNIPIFAHCLHTAVLHTTLLHTASSSLYKHPSHSCIFLVYSALKSVDLCNHLLQTARSSTTEHVVSNDHSHNPNSTGHCRLTCICHHSVKPVLLRQNLFCLYHPTTYII